MGILLNIAACSLHALVDIYDHNLTSFHLIATWINDLSAFTPVYRYGVPFPDTPKQKSEKIFSGGSFGDN